MDLRQIVELDGVDMLGHIADQAMGMQLGGIRGHTEFVEIIPRRV